MRFPSFSAGTMFIRSPDFPHVNISLRAIVLHTPNIYYQRKTYCYKQYNSNPHNSIGGELLDAEKVAFNSVYLDDYAYQCKGDIMSTGRIQVFFKEKGKGSCRNKVYKGE
jgi:hypothetical protein